MHFSLNAEFPVLGRSGVEPTRKNGNKVAHRHEPHLHDAAGHGSMPRGIVEMRLAAKHLAETTPFTPFGTAKKKPQPGVRRKTNGSLLKWVRGEPLGCGALGTAYKALDVETGKFIAVKEISVQEADEETLLALKRELLSYEELRHPYIVGYLGHEQAKSALYIYLEYMPGGSLHQTIQTYGPIEEPLMRIYTKQLLLGLEHLHSRGFIHRDVKGGNVLVGLQRRVKLSDFGCCKQIFGNSGSLGETGAGGATGAITQTMTGSLQWMAPEVGCNGGWSGWGIR